MRYAQARARCRSSPRHSYGFRAIVTKVLAVLSPGAWKTSAPKWLSNSTLTFWRWKGWVDDVHLFVSRPPRRRQPTLCADSKTAALAC